MDEFTGWFDVTKIGTGTFQISEGRGCLQCNSFVLTGSDRPLVVDTGLGIGDLREVVKRLIGSDVRVLLTHSHWDHIGAAHQFEGQPILARERSDDGRVAIDTLSHEFDDRPAEFVADWRDGGNDFPRGFDPDSYVIESVADVGPPGDTISLGDRRVEVVDVPGHSPGQVAVLDRERGICHGADIVAPGGLIYAHFQDSDVAAYRESLARLIDHRDEGAFDTLTTGHGDPISGSELSVLDDAAEAMERVATGTTSSELVETNWGATRNHSVGSINILTRP